MLKLNEIVKTYQVADQKVEALKGVNIEFRASEFVSVLGPSGCGKTTLLNIIGGLDRYTSGDLIINGKSTKQFKDRDWDNYRNHRVGFVFQSYNLIPHQTVLENVELALTLSGVSRKERKQRAFDVLKRVGLADKVKNKPSQLSGGQMQRVAIARALVNDPDIILADEPTGALDSVTSVQIMELLKEISSDRLIVMVTHNPELAEKYSTRIIKLLDGQVTSDSKPLTDKERKEEIKKEEKLQKEAEEAAKDKKNKPKKAKMSVFTAMALSFKNLLTKKGRTMLVAFAGSIGIIGIALILAISSGFNAYINKSQEDTLSTYPITIQAKNIDFASLAMQMFLGDNESSNKGHGNDDVYPKDSISSVINSIGQNLKANDLGKFYKYLNDNIGKIKDKISGIQYTYDIGLEFYQQSGVAIQPNSPALMQMIIKYSLCFVEDKAKVDIEFLSGGGCRIIAKEETDFAFFDSYKELSAISLKLKQEGEISLNGQQVFGLVMTILGFSTGGASGGNMASMFMNMDVVTEMLDNDALLDAQYELIAGKLIENDNDALLVLDKNNELDDYILYALGLMTDEQLTESMRALVKGEKNPVSINYESIVGKEYKVLSKSDYYVEDEGKIIDFRIFNMPTLENGEPNPAYSSEKYNYYYSRALSTTTNTVKISGIIRLNKATKVGSIKSGLAYSNKFTKSMLDYTNSSLAVSSGELSAIELSKPESINIYVNTFEAKDAVKAFIDEYNKTAKNGDEISYSDMVGMMMSTISTIINAITYVLVAFVGVSLVVSSIMIGVITYISVIERTKEIGVLRSVGASKRDVRRVFTSESFMIGLVSGVFGIIVSFLLTIPINIVLNHFTGLGNIAMLPWLGSLILIVISVLLTLVAGLIPARAASKKDPVIALRES